MKIKKMYQGTVPENKILDGYSDSKTDTYCCDFVNKLKSYSSEEHFVGIWFGEAYYKKTIIKNNFALTPGDVFAHGISNVEKIISKEGAINFASTGQGRSFPIVANNGSIVDFYADPTNITIVGSDNWVASTDRTIYFTLIYTKTTD